MKNIKSISIIVFIAFLLTNLFSACSNDVINNEISQEDGKRGVRFSFSFQDFEKDEKVTSRATADDVLSRDVVDLGNNIEAEVLVKSENVPTTNTQVTRATLSNGHYTILAYQGSAIKGTIKGTWNGTAFVPDTGYDEAMLLPAGIYTFVCFNDRITQNGSTLKLVRTSTSEAALLGVNRDVTVVGLKQSVSFTMKHPECRMKIYLDMYRAIVNEASIYSNINTTLSSVNATGVPAVANYDVVNDTWTNSGGVAVNEADIQGSKESANYHYFLPSTQGSSFKLTFNTGKVYGHFMTNRSLKLYTSGRLTMKAGKSYVVWIKLHYKFTYLFSDGTTGTLAANPTKAPIALVVNGPTRTAIALKDANKNKILWTTRSGEQNVNKVSLDGPSPYQNPPTGPTVYDGYNETWNASYSKDGITVKAESEDFPAFKTAAEYNPGVSTVATIGKWYLPAAGEFLYLRDTLSLGNTVRWDDTYMWAFTRAGGKQIILSGDYYTDPGNTSIQHVFPSYYSMEKTYFSSSEKDNDNAVSGAFCRDEVTDLSLIYWDYRINVLTCPALKNQAKYVRSYVHY